MHSVQLVSIRAFQFTLFTSGLAVDIHDRACCRALHGASRVVPDSLEYSGSADCRFGTGPRRTVVADCCGSQLSGRGGRSQEGRPRKHCSGQHLVSLQTSQAAQVIKIHVN